MKGRHGDTDNWIEVKIQDDGPGIAPKLQTRVVEPFFTIKPAGQSEGLGLSIAHRIVSELDGTLSLESVPGQGATFIVRLPAREESAQNRNAEASSSVRREEKELLNESTSNVTRWSELRLKGRQGGWDDSCAPAPRTLRRCSVHGRSWNHPSHP